MSMNEPPRDQPSPAGGWFPDVERPGGMRYWDGAQWTEHRQAPPAAADSWGGAPSPPGFAGSFAGGFAGPGISSDGQFWVSSMGQESGPFSHGQLQMMAVAKQVTAATLVRSSSGGWFPLSQVGGVFSDKDWTTALILSILVGGLGVDQFYLGNTGLGIGKLLTLGGCGIWALIDIIRIATNSVPDSMGRPLRK